jgi:hypothetical protein
MGAAASSGLYLLFSLLLFMVSCSYYFPFLHPQSSSRVSSLPTKSFGGRTRCRRSRNPFSEEETGVRSVVDLCSEVANAESGEREGRDAYGSSQLDG